MIVHSIEVQGGCTIIVGEYYGGSVKVRKQEGLSMGPGYHSHMAGRERDAMEEES